MGIVGSFEGILKAEWDVLLTVCGKFSRNVRGILQIGKSGRVFRFALVKRPNPYSSICIVEKSRAVSFSEFGKPDEVLSLIERPLNTPGADEVVVAVRAATINPSDFGMILGNYGRLPDLPAVAGREGVGEVIEVGMGVGALRVGDRVSIPEGTGAWQSHFVASADQLVVIPEGIPDEYAAMARINPPTAWRLLRDSYLQPGQWVVQNGANSSVGLFVIQMAKHLGLKTLNIVRREELIEPLQKLGADVVVTEDSGYEKKVAELTNKGEVQLALNSIGGESAIRLVRCLSKGGTHVTFGAMAFEPVRFPTRDLIFNGISLTGFWMDRWYRENSRERNQVMFDNLYNMVREGIIHAPVAAKYPLAQFKEALAASREPRLGKILLVP